jgi:hypothetical protein
VEGPCEHGNEPSGSIKCWELLNGYATGGFSRRTQLHGVSLVSCFVVILNSTYNRYDYPREMAWFSLGCILYQPSHKRIIKSCIYLLFFLTAYFDRIKTSGENTNRLLLKYR